MEHKNNNESIFRELSKTLDAAFALPNLNKHYEERQRYGEIPGTMTKEQYHKEGERVSLLPINGKSVRAYKYRGDRVAKSDGKWFVSYANGKNGILITAFPLRGGMNRFEQIMKRDNGQEIYKE